MSPVKDVTENEMVYLFPMAVRVVGVICFVFAAGFGTGVVTSSLGEKNVGALILFASCALFFFLGGVYCCKITKVTFDHTGGIIKITKDLGPLRWGSLHIPKEQLEKVTVENAAELAWGWLIYQSGEEAVSMRVKGRKRPINIIIMDDGSASHLAYRIKTFIE